MKTLSVEDIATDLDIEPEVVKRLIKIGNLKAELPAHKIGYRVKVEDYEEFLKLNWKFKKRLGLVKENGGTDWEAQKYICKNLITKMYVLQEKFIDEDHEKRYSDGWNDCMNQIDKLVKELWAENRKK